MSIPSTRRSGALADGHRRSSLNGPLMARAARPLKVPGPIAPGQKQPLRRYSRNPLQAIRVPENLQQPILECHEQSGGRDYTCTRALDHAGRHAQINWVTKIVRAVWGVRDQADPRIERDGAL